MSVKNIASAYRRLLKVARGLPHEKRIEITDRVRAEFRAPRSADAGVDGVSPSRLRELLEEAESKIGWIKIVTPKELRPKLRSDSGEKTFVMKDGKLVETTRGGLQNKAISGYSETNIDPEAVQKHQQLIKRQYFGGPGRGNSDGRGNPLR